MRSKIVQVQCAYCGAAADAAVDVEDVEQLQQELQRVRAEIQTLQMQKLQQKQNSELTRAVQSLKRPAPAATSVTVSVEQEKKRGCFSTLASLIGWLFLIALFLSFLSSLIGA